MHTLYMSIISVTFLFLLTKLMGYRQMSQMSMFDYVVGITIGSLGAEVATNVDGNVFVGLLAMSVYALATLLMGYINRKSMCLRSLLLGKVLVLYDDGRIDYRHLQKAKMDLNELLFACRNAGYFDLQELSLILLEVNGQLSFLPKVQNRPLMVCDVKPKKETPHQERPIVAVVLDGKCCLPSLKAIGKSEAWLMQALSKQGYPSLAKVLLATVDDQNTLMIYERYPNQKSKAYYV